MGTVISTAKRAGNVSVNMARLYDALLSLKTRAECAAFLRDLCTPAELKEFGERLQIASLLVEDMSYRDISDKTGASTTTITRVAQWYHHGRGGYRTALSRLT